MIFVIPEIMNYPRGEVRRVEGRTLHARPRCGELLSRQPREPLSRLRPPNRGLVRAVSPLLLTIFRLLTRLSPSMSETTIRVMRTEGLKFCLLVIFTWILVQTSTDPIMLMSLPRSPLPPRLLLTGVLKCLKQDLKTQSKVFLETE